MPARHLLFAVNVSKTSQYKLQWKSQKEEYSADQPVKRTRGNSGKQANGKSEKLKCQKEEWDQSSSSNKSCNLKEPVQTEAAGERATRGGSQS